MLRSTQSLRVFLLLAPVLVQTIPSTGVSAAVEKTIVKDMSEVFSVGPRPSFSPAVSETTIKHEVFYTDFESGSTGWGVMDFRAPLPNAWNVVSGTHSCVGSAWWCGQSGFANGDGYDNNWVQILKTVAPINLTGSSNNKLTFKHRIQSEYGFDWGWVLIHDGSQFSAWDTLASYSGDFGSSCSNVSLDIADSWTIGPQPIQLMFLFGSDLTVSTADSAGGYTGWSLDDVKITAQGSIVKFFDDMENPAVTASQWYAGRANPGAHWHVESGPETTPTTSSCAPDGAPASFLSSTLWVPFAGSIFGNVPDFTDAMLTSPPMDIGGVANAASGTLRLQFDDWIDLPFDNGMYWSLWIRGSDDLVTWTPWHNALNPLVFSGGTAQCILGSYVNFDPYNTSRTGIQPGTRYIRLGFRLRDEKQVSTDAAILRLGLQTEGIYFDNIGVYYIYTISGVEAVSGVPTDARASLRKVYPNPFNPTTTIEFSVPKPGPVSVRIFDVRGKLVATVVDGPVDAGVYRVRWNGKSDNGSELSSGVYFARLVGSGSRDSARLMMLK